MLELELTPSFRPPSDAIADPRCLKIVARASAVTLMSTHPLPHLRLHSTPIFYVHLESECCRNKFALVARDRLCLRWQALQYLHTAAFKL